MRLALCILIALQVLDVATTAYAITTGTGRESNLIAASILAAGGFPGLVAAKTAAVAYVSALFLYMPAAGRPALGFVIRAMAVAYLFVVYSNLKVGGLV